MVRRSGPDILCTSDNHFGHHRMRELAERPEGYEERILENLDKRVQPGDVLINLGDVALYKDREWHERFTGMFRDRAKLWLVLGNHDKRSWGWYMDRGWDFVASTITLHRYGHSILFTHRPQAPGEYATINVHGHLHQMSHRLEEHYMLDQKDNFLVSMELQNYQPTSLRRICETMDARRRNAS